MNYFTELLPSVTLIVYFAVCVVVASWMISGLIGVRTRILIHDVEQGAILSRNFTGIFKLLPPMYGGGLLAFIVVSQVLYVGVYYLAEVVYIRVSRGPLSAGFPGLYSVLSSYYDFPSFLVVPVAVIVVASIAYLDKSDLWVEIAKARPLEDDRTSDDVVVEFWKADTAYSLLRMSWQGLTGLLVLLTVLGLTPMVGSIPPTRRLIDLYFIDSPTPADVSDLNKIANESILSCIMVLILFIAVRSSAPWTYFSHCISRYLAHFVNGGLSQPKDLVVSEVPFSNSYSLSYRRWRSPAQRDAFLLADALDSRRRSLSGSRLPGWTLETVKSAYASLSERIREASVSEGRTLNLSESLQIRLAYSTMRLCLSDYLYAEALCTIELARNAHLSVERRRSRISRFLNLLRQVVDSYSATIRFVLLISVIIFLLFAGRFSDIVKPLLP